MGFGGNVCGTPGWASRNEPVEGGDWPACAKALLTSGMPGPRPDPAGSGDVIIGDRRHRFSDEVREVLLNAGA